MEEVRDRCRRAKGSRARTPTTSSRRSTGGSQGTSRTFVARRLRDHHLAQDIVQETFIRAYRSIDTLDSDRPVWPWLSAIATRLCLNAVRDRRRAARASLRLVREGGRPDRGESPYTDPETYLRSRERRVAIFDAFGTLDPRQRRLLVLRHQRGWSYAQIAALEGATLDAVKSALKRGRYAFRRAYSAIATERGLSVLMWPVVGRTVRRVRSLRDWARGEIASGVQLGRALNIPLDTAASLVLATVVAGALIVDGIRGPSVSEDRPPAPLAGLAATSTEAARAVPVEGLGSAEVGGTAAASVGSAPSGGVATGASVETAATSPVDTGAYAGGTNSGGGTYTAASASLSAPPVASEDPAASVEASGEVEKDNPDMRRVRVSYDREIDGQDAPLKGTGHFSADVPCTYFGPEQHACDAIDTVTEEAPPAGSDPPPAEWGPPPESEAESEPAESEAESEPAESEAESDASEPEPSPDPDE